MIRRSLLLFLILCGSALGQPQTILDQDTLPSATLDASPDQIFVLTDVTGSPARTYKTSIASILAQAQASSAVQECDRIVVGSDDVDTDEENLDTAIDELNTQGYGTLWIVGTVQVDKAYAFDAPISLRGLGSHAVIHVVDGAADFHWGGYFSASTGWSTMSATAAKASRIESTSLALAEGDWILVKSADRLTELMPHLYYLNGGAQYPMEMHTVVDDAGSNFYYLGDFIADALTTTPQVLKLTILSQPGLANRSNVVIDNLTLTRDELAEDNVLFDVRRCNGVLVQNIRWAESEDGHAGPGYFVFHFCANVMINHCTTDLKSIYTDVEPEIYGYIFTTGVVNGLDLNGCFFRGDPTKHFFTTTSSYSSGNGRWGTPRAVHIHDNTIYSTGTDGSGNVAIDFHAEGYGGVVENNTIHLGSKSGVTAYGIQSRSRASTIRGNTIYGNGPTIGIRVYEDDAVVMDNRIVDCYRAISVTLVDAAAAPGYAGNRCIIKNNVISGGTGTPGRIYITAGNDHKIVGNTITGSPSGAILIARGDDNDVIKNDIHDAGTGGSNATISYYGTDSSAIFTVDAGTNIVTSTSHGLIDGQDITVTSSTTLPAGLSASTTYYVNKIDDNTFYLVTTRLDANGPAYAGDAATAVDITDTGTGTHTWHIINSSADSDVVHNVLHNCGEIAVEFLGGSDNNHVVGNVFHDCSDSTTLIKYVDGEGHRVHRNDIWLEVNTNSIDTGNLAAIDIGIFDNTMTGYGTGSMGLTGTNAAAIDANFDAYNTIDP